MKKSAHTAEKVLRRWLCVVFFLVAEVGPVYGQLDALYHAITAYYNAYFLAKDDLRKIEKHLIESEQRNYEALLPVLIPLEPAQLEAKKENIENCIKRASYSIYKHPGSRWVYHAYLALGKARLFNQEHEDALITFRYINTKSSHPLLRQYAMMHLARTHLVRDELPKAEKILEYLEREPMSKKRVEKDKLLLQAYVAQRKGALPQMADHLEHALPLLRKRQERIRIFFLLGQYYKQTKQPDRAHKMFGRCMRANPPYETYLTAQLERMQVMPIAKKRGIKKMNRRYRRVLKEKKNADSRAKIYHAWGNSLHNQELLDEAVEKFLSSIDESNEDVWQKINTLLRLGEIYYDEMEMYAASFPHYDSLISLLPGEEAYDPVRKRHAILQRYVPHYETVQTQDSLLALADMEPAALEAFLTERLEEKRSAFASERRKKKAERAAQNSIGGRINLFDETQTINPLGESDSQWYFYLPQAVSQGRSVFKRQWGDRPLQDGWRNKTELDASSSVLTEPTAVENTALESSTAQEQPSEQKEEGFALTLEDLKKEIPLTEAAQQEAHEAVANALFEMGKIYRFEMKKGNEARAAFKRFLQDYAQHPQEPEVLYLLFLDEELPQAEREDYKEQLITKYPEALFTKLAINPNYLVEEEQAHQALQQAYNTAYRHYARGEYAQTMRKVKQGLAENTGEQNPFVDNAEFLLALAEAKLSPPYVYPLFLKNFLRKNAESELGKYAKTLLDAAEKKHVRTVVSSLPRYEGGGKKAPLIVWLYPTQENEYVEKNLVGLIDQHLPAEGHAGNVLLDSAHYLLIVLPGEKTEAAFYEALKEDEEIVNFSAKEGISMFYISEKDLTELYLTRDHTLYLSFFEQEYNN